MVPQIDKIIVFSTFNISHFCSCSMEITKLLGTTRWSTHVLVKDCMSCEYFNCFLRLPFKTFVDIILQEPWRELANAFANEKMLFMLNASHQVGFLLLCFWYQWFGIITSSFVTLLEIPGSDACSFCFWLGELGSSKSVSAFILILFLSWYLECKT